MLYVVVVVDTLDHKLMLMLSLFKATLMRLLGSLSADVADKTKLE